MLSIMLFVIIMLSFLMANVLIPTKNPYRRGIISTVDLHVLTSLVQLLFTLKILLTFFTKQATLMRRSSVLTFPFILYSMISPMGHTLLLLWEQKLWNYLLGYQDIQHNNIQHNITHHYNKIKTQFKNIQQNVTRRWVSFMPNVTFLCRDSVWLVSSY